MAEARKECIDKRLLPIKGHYFFFNAGTGPVIPFLSVYAKQLGFSGSVVGLIYTILPITGMLCKPIAGAIADRFFIQKPLFLVSILLTGLGMFAIYFSPSVPPQADVRFSCEGIAEFNVCKSKYSSLNLGSDLNKTIECQMNCPFVDSNADLLCTQWNPPGFCKERPDNFQFLAEVPLDKAVKIGDCFFFRVSHVKIENVERKVANCQKKMSSFCSLHCNNQRVNELTKDKELNTWEVLETYQFWLFLVLMTLMWDAMAIVTSVGDTICFELLGDQPSKYGAQRCWGALGWGILVIITGLIVDAVSNGETEKNYLPAFLLSVGFLIIHFICCFFIEYNQQVYETNIFKGVAKLFKDIRVIVFMAWCVFMGLLTGLMWNFYLWLVEELAEDMENSKDWISTLEGILLSVQTLLGELPFFWLSGYLLRRIGHINCMNLILLVFGLRLILYSVITNPWYFIPVEISNGLTFGIFYAAMTSYASVIAPPGASTTVQGLVGALFEGVGVSLGSLIAGTLTEKYGGILTFRYFGIASLVVCLVHFFVQLKLKEKKPEDFSTRYSSPVDALSMLSDDCQELRLVT